MALNTSTLLSRFNSLSSQPVTRQLGLLLGLAASIALGIGLVQWSMAPDYVALFGEMTPSSTNEVVRSLEENGTPYKVDHRTGLVSVPAEKLHEIRLKLASDGLPKSDGSGFDMLYKEQKIGVSGFIEKARYDRALEQELARSIASLDSVRSARIHLALPKQSAFVRKRDKPAASVLLSLYPGRELTERQLAGVVHLVASSVPGLEAEQVSVVDNQGKLLSAQGREEGFAQTSEQFRFTQQLEQSYVDRITEILSPILGVGAVRAQVVADVDFTRVEKTSESYAPETSVRSEQLIEENSRGEFAGGVPGTLANQPPEETRITAVPEETEDQLSSGRFSKRQVRNYEIDKTISHIREVPGTLQKLSVAVVVDYQDTVNGDGNVERAAIAEARLAEITALVKDAIGFSAERGDSVNVMNAMFVVPPELEQLSEPSLMEQEWIWRAAKFLLAGIAIFLIIFTVLRPLMQASAAPPPGTALAATAQGGAGTAYATASQGGMALSEDHVTLGGQSQLGLPGASSYQNQLQMARSMAEGEPQRVAHVVKNWVSADG
ncbi:MAG: flagellar basal-body MS-ring/collar protein FliF [Porticoccus sp.]|mgnify:CR=1 FL=1|uniref:flagellar basal-body MS-ring/collar protein FliF n=1 Tax=Porticoccus TaxID=1123967 RepID=UPI0023553B8C|nr:flagellar basal-body MS-ring/collar protein FliF [Porticoccus hydrocarbonoclasticus]|tara:strand:+ start:728255 stop:729904 length:1650 start_codon:yes stop_codon:yes gene_type:complete